MHGSIEDGCVLETDGGDHMIVTDDGDGLRLIEAPFDGGRRFKGL